MTKTDELFLLEPRFTRLLHELDGGKRRIHLHGLVPESTGPFVAALAAQRECPVFVVSESAVKARAFTEELQNAGVARAYTYPEEELQFFKTDSTISPVSRQRLSVLQEVYAGGTMVVSTTLSALKRRIVPPRRYAESVVTLAVDTSVSEEEVIRKLVAMRYVRTTSVEHAGEFSVRGDILDVFPPASKLPYRIEFFDTDIERIHSFEVETQRSVDPHEKILLTPAENLLFTDADCKDVLSRMRVDLKQAEAVAKKHHLHPNLDKFYHLMDELETNNHVSNPDLAEAYLNDDSTAGLMDYLPDDAVIVLDDISRILETEKRRDALALDTYTTLAEQSEILKAHLSHRLTITDVYEALGAYALVNLTQILKSVREFTPDALLQIRSMEAENFNNRWSEFTDALHWSQKQKKKIVLAVGSGKEALAERLLASDILFTNETPRTRFKDIKDGEILLSSLSLGHGFLLPDGNLHIISRTEIFGKEKKRKAVRRPRRKSDLLNYQDLAPGDYVVHEIYGIGEFLGTETIEYDGLKKDFIKISYKGADALYVPTDEMDLVTKYIGSGGPKPRISSLGGSEWKRSKEKARKAVDAIAEDLLELYAKRSKVKGHAFAADSPWQQEFEESFLYEETPSQLRAAEEIKADMESSKPMDRLLCGDVGYGKTEVALRAAFKAVMDGKQVAFLAPTTILVQQHYQTMMDRFLSYPMRIEFLSRFKSAEKQKAVVKQIRQGSVDIVVGTHRLLSKDIQFKDLGLLIVDEEQRFGVKDKEKMKKIKENVDVLTLSATPIPRTLQLSLTGIRDMSLLEEPPEERYPTISYVMETDPVVLRDAIRRELDRNGQVYVVHNRVHDIHFAYERLQALVPEARIVVAHGQMSIRELENVMEQFVSGEADILLATTIIETGMDIANVNTLIVEQADRMGLSQLYQLKGRIGRSDRQSYAYFTYDRSKVLSEISEKRLKAIRDFTEFGSGYKIAMRDLELRGAGNLLGESQSGHIESIGYELYVRMLEEAVSRAKGEAKTVHAGDINVDVKVSAFIPDEYIPQSSDKIMMYRQIASIENEEEYSKIVEELLDRFGDPPESVENLLDIALIKRWASDLGFSRIKETKEAIELRYEKFEQFSVEQLKAISEGYSGPLTFDFQKEPRFKIAVSPHKLKDTKRLLQLMTQLKNREEKE
ncbi:transcription-repair coupling factor [Levyella massiliensis]|uniref:transcription-repair coupling factor n=1 Tax=Levyella massiliensis TaxID=938289 RepID=UPI00035F789F|nr:transcription-repair coupling factor [Levyella massiliensis]